MIDRRILRNRGGKVPLVVGVGMLLALMWPASADCQTEEELWRFGFSRAIFSERSENDTIAAMQAWSQLVLNERRNRVKTSFYLYDSPEQMAEAVGHNEIDTLVFQFLEYPLLPSDLIRGPCFRTNVNGKTHKQFVLLARGDGEIVGLEDLSATHVVVFDGESPGLPVLWLDAELAANGLGPLSKVVSTLEQDRSASAAVLGLFFGKYDACIVARRVFDSMAELNPQVAAQLEVLAVSPEIIPSAFCFHSEFDEDQKEKLLSEIERLHETTAGRQVINIFKAERMERIDDETVRRSLDLILDWQRTAQR